MKYNLTDRAILGIDGKDSADFLQSVITNDIYSLKEGEGIYSAHLTPKGKFLYDFFIYKHEDMYMIDCHKAELMALAKSFYSYVVAKAVSFNDLTEDYMCIGSDKPLKDNVFSYADPRYKAMGYRNWVRITHELDTHSLEAYHKKRIELCMIDGAYDGLKERSLINEMRFEALHGVNFEKGCYIGQELTARTKFRTEPKKKIYHITFNGKATNGDDILCGKMKAGNVFSSTDGKGIAIIRTRYLEKPLTLNGLEITYEEPVWAK